MRSLQEELGSEYKNNLLSLRFPNQEAGPEDSGVVELVNHPFGMMTPSVVSEAPSFISVISWIPPTPREEERIQILPLHKWATVGPVPLYTPHTPVC